MTASPGLARAPWWSHIGPRFRFMWFMKGAWTMSLIAVFFAAYFWVLKHPASTPYTMPLTALDEWIAFRPEAFGLYVTLWLYLSLPPSILKDRREVVSYGVATSSMSVVGLAIFLLWPTTVPDFALDWSVHPSLAFMKSVDVAGNACPSLHVAYAVFTALWLARMLREMGERGPLRVLSALWGLGIVYSTMAIRQHVALDVLAGALLGGGTAWLHFLWLGRPASSAGRAARGRSVATRS